MLPYPSESEREVGSSLLPEDRTLEENNPLKGISIRHSVDLLHKVLMEICDIHIGSKY